MPFSPINLIAVNFSRGLFANDCVDVLSQIMDTEEPMGYLPKYDEVGFVMPANNQNLLISCIATHDGRNDKVNTFPS